MLYLTPTYHVDDYKMCSAIDLTSEFQTTDEGWSVFSRPLDEFNVGRTFYKLIRPVNVGWAPVNHHWVCNISRPSGYLGTGKTQDESFEELKVQIHTDFQKLQRMRPFEMNADERERWTKLTSLIDLLYYKTTTPITCHEVGQVSHGRISRPWRIKWLTGKNYLIQPEQVPGELMSCAPGQWIEAIVKKHPIRRNILEIESVRKINFRIPSKAAVKNFWNKMSEAELESTGWEW